MEKNANVWIGHCSPDQSAQGTAQLVIDMLDKSAMMQTNAELHVKQGPPKHSKTASTVAKRAVQREAIPSRKIHGAIVASRGSGLSTRPAA